MIARSAHRLVGLLSLVLPPFFPALAQATPSNMVLVLIDDAGQRSVPFPILGGTVIISRNDPGHTSGNAADAVAADRADLAFDPPVAADSRLLTWLAKSGAGAKAEITVTGTTSPIIYVLSGINSRVTTLTQSNDGAGQTSLVLGAEHGSINGVPLN